MQFGQHAYGLYVYHVAVQSILLAQLVFLTSMSTDVAKCCLACAVIAGTFAVARLSKWAFEDPILRLKKRFET